MWELDYKESWALKNWCFWAVVLEKTLESPLDSKEIQPVHPKGNRSWIFTGRIDVEADTPILWPPDVKNWCFLTLVLEKTLESPLDCKEIKPVTPRRNQSWICVGRTDAEAETPIVWSTWWDELTHWKRPWCWERLRAGVERDNRGWDSWMASPTQWTWVWASSGICWWTGKPDMLLSMRLQRVRHDWETELNWTDIPIKLL